MHLSYIDFYPTARERRGRSDKWIIRKFVGYKKVRDFTTDMSILKIDNLSRQEIKPLGIRIPAVCD